MNMSSYRTLNTRYHTTRGWIIYYLMIVVPFVFVLPNVMVECQFVNRPPHFVPGSGDMARFSLSENTPVDSPVYQLRGKEMFLRWKKRNLSDKYLDARFPSWFCLLRKRVYRNGMNDDRNIFWFPKCYEEPRMRMKFAISSQFGTHDYSVLCTKVCRRNWILSA